MGVGSSRVKIRCRGVGNGRGISKGRRPNGKGNTMKEWTDEEKSM
jgi:hypothetical protein